jgi:uncharacterized protein
MRLLMLFTWILLAAAGCTAGTPTVSLRGHDFKVEIADDNAERMRGLMFRDHMDADAGMLFLFDQQEPQAFWMKNTRIPLDILYFDSNWFLVGWSLNTPPCSLGDNCPSYPSHAPAKFVLELNAGTASRIGAEMGDKLGVQGVTGH